VSKKPSKEDIAFDNEISRVSRLVLDLIVKEHEVTKDPKAMLLALGKSIAALSMEFSIRHNVDRTAVLDWTYSYAASAQFEFADGWAKRKLSS